MRAAQKTEMVFSVTMCVKSQQCLKLEPAGEGKAFVLVSVEALLYHACHISGLTKMQLLKRKEECKNNTLWLVGGFWTDRKVLHVCLFQLE